ncbi:PREDICTED: transcriptional regulatory protein AlgP [Drosophila arizonae]|uniref:Transcriptional regulatory protein AlgP n=1 Tax=Drosophila arizonae TaxID=7263 RepID=A0ABM1NZU4_DROAR|nr:PREDICTED: transcriptional regulatory protein AlgP [Drosophila arizonae]
MKLVAAVLFACVATLALLHSVYGTPVPPANPEAPAANAKPAANPEANPASSSAPNPVPNLKGPAANPAPNQTDLLPNDELLGTTADNSNPLYRVSLQDADAKEAAPVAVHSLAPSNSNLPANAAYPSEAAPSVDAAPNLNEIGADGAADQQVLVV